ncbi:hypothetical protein BH10BAC6_BH10BAC6_13360 [soil metagenome]
MKKQEITIEGMSCGHCVAAVERALSKIDGIHVEDVTIGKAIVEIEESTTVSEKIERAIQAAGFRMVSLVLAAFAILAFVGCTDSSSGPTPSKAQLRTINTASDAAALDVQLDGTVTNASVTYGKSSGYASVVAGSKTLKVLNAGASAALITAGASLEEGKSYSVFVFGPSSAITASLQNDDLLTSAKARVRFVHAVSDLSASIDIHTVNALNPAILSKIESRAVTAYTALDAGSLTFVVTTNGSSTPLTTYEPIALASNTSYTVVLMGTMNPGDAVSMVARMYTDTDSGSASVDLVEHFDKGKVLAVHAVSDAPAVDVSVDGTKVITGLAYPNSSPYQLVDPGERTVSVSAGAIPVASIKVAVEVGKAYSVFAIGTVAGGLESLKLTDETVPNSAQALVRFINASPASAPVDLITNIGPSVYEIPGMQNIPYKGVSVSASSGKSYLLLPPGAYTMKVRLHSTGSILVELPDLSFEANKIYTLWVGGKLGSTPITLNTIKHN